MIGDGLDDGLPLVSFGVLDRLRYARLLLLLLLLVSPPLISHSTTTATTTTLCIRAY